jgi:hypothetical protein
VFFPGRFKQNAVYACDQDIVSLKFVRPARLLPWLISARPLSPGVRRRAASLAPGTRMAI